MSGIVGTINLDGSPVDRELLDRMTGFMAFRGPDAQATWGDGPAGFGHTLLRTTWESEHEEQPYSMDGQVWITADARIDDRANLIDQLAGHGRQATPDVPDVELILHAYHAWGENCVEHLLGDFAFAIWDRRRRRLLCACDHFGIKPFYYAQVGASLVFSNTLNCLRLHPDVSDELNEAVIGDFLLFGYNAEPATTTFGDIRRLLPAHTLTCEDGAIRLRRYWVLTLDDEARYRRPEDYVDRFRELLRVAVSDRVRTSRVAILMGGGLDSTAVAAVAREGPCDVRAYTVVYDRLIPDRERHYAELAAEGLGIPIQCLAADDYKLYERWDNPELLQPEPMISPFLAMVRDNYKRAAAHSRVALTGWDGDALLSERPHVYFGMLWKGRRFLRLTADLWRFVRSRRDVPRLGFRTRLKRWLGLIPPPQPNAFPTWIDPAFATRWHLRARRDEVFARQPPGHPRRPYGCAALALMGSGAIWDHYDAGATGIPLEQRHPFLDLRLVRYLLSIPPVPCCIDKELLRVALRGILPEAVRLRPKAPLAGDPVLEALRGGDSGWLKAFRSAAPGLGHYVNLAAIPDTPPAVDPEEANANLCTLGVAYWLQSITRTHHEGANDVNQLPHQQAV